MLSIQRALNDHLDALPGEKWPIAWENREFNPAGQHYLRPTLLPTERVGAGIGTAAQNREAGIYQIDVFIPARGGKGEALLMADRLASHFRRGTIIQNHGLNIRVRSASISAGTTTADYYQVPVEVRWLTYTDNV